MLISKPINRLTARKSMNKYVRKLRGRIIREGTEVLVRNLWTKEITGIDFKIKDPKFAVEETIDQTAYRTEKKREVQHQIDAAIGLLAKDRNSRQAVIQFDQHSVKDSTPNCFVSMQFMVRKNELTVIVFQRSLDVINKLESDMNLVMYIGQEVSRSTRSKFALVKWFVGSAHIYKGN